MVLNPSIYGNPTLTCFSEPVGGSHTSTHITTSPQTTHVISNFNDYTIPKLQSLSEFRFGPCSEAIGGTHAPQHLVVQLEAHQSHQYLWIFCVNCPTIWKYY